MHSRGATTAATGLWLTIHETPPGREGVATRSRVTRNHGVSHSVSLERTCHIGLPELRLPPRGLAPHVVRRRRSHGTPGPHGFVQKESPADYLRREYG